MDHFLCEIFDVLEPAEIEDIESIFDRTAKLMVYHNIYKHPMILSNIVFCFCYEQCLGIFPSKIEFKSFLRIHPLETQNFDNYAARTMDYMAKHTFYKYIAHLSKIPASDIVKACTQYVNSMRMDPSFSVKAVLEKKMKKRLLPSIEILSERSLTGNKNKKNEKKENEKNKEGIDTSSDSSAKTLFVIFNDIINLSGMDASAFYEMNRRLIFRDHLLTHNIYTDFILYPLSEEQEAIFSKCRVSTVTIIDCIAYQMSRDYCFQRMIMAKPFVANYSATREHRELAFLVRSALDKTHENSASVLGEDHDMSSICCHSQDESMTKSERAPYVSCPHILNYCVPRIMGTFVWIPVNDVDGVNDMDDVNDVNDVNSHDQMSTKSLTGANMLFNFGEKKNNHKEEDGFWYYQIVRDDAQIRASRTLMLPFWKEVVETEGKKKDEKDSHPLTMDLLTVYFKDKCAKTMRDKHFSSTLSLARNYSLKYMAKYGIPVFSQRRDFSESVKEATNCILYVDNRKNIQGVYNIIITLSNLQKGNWGIVILTSRGNRAFYEEHLGPGIQFIENERMDAHRFNIEHYNMMIKNERTWEDLLALGYQKCLIVQDDSMILRKGMEERFMRYDFVGPPWRMDEGNKPLVHYVGSNFVGNGGLSLRTIEKMAQICRTYRAEKNILFNGTLQTIPEDVYFSMMCRNCQASIPSYEEASLFAMEQVYNKNALGVHKFWVYLKQDLVIEYFDSL